MQAGYYQATGGMVTQFNRLDVISNNLANLNTEGYKRDDVVIGDFMRVLKGAQDELPYANQTKTASSFVNRTLDRVPQVVQGYTNFGLGDMLRTGNALDTALKSDDTFFTVQTPAGIRYTRAGSFKVSDEGTLVTKEGYPVVSTNFKADGQPIRIPQDTQDVTIDAQGNISVRGAGTAVPNQVGTLAVVKFDTPLALEKIGNNLYDAKTQEALPVTNESVVAQGFIEKSNVNPVNEMVALIETNRLVGIYQKVMDTQMNDLNPAAITQLAANKA